MIFPLLFFLISNSLSKCTYHETCLRRHCWRSFPVLDVRIILYQAYPIWLTCTFIILTYFPFKWILQRSMKQTFHPYLIRRHSVVVQIQYIYIYIYLISWHHCSFIITTCFGPYWTVFRWGTYIKPIKKYTYNSYIACLWVSKRTWLKLRKKFLQSV
jgi:hypothetical protein